MNTLKPKKRKARCKHPLIRILHVYDETREKVKKPKGLEKMGDLAVMTVKSICNECNRVNVHPWVFYFPTKL